MNPVPWYKTATRTQWKTLVAAQLGWLLDSMDVMLYAFALTTIRTEFGLTSASAGAVASVTLVASGLGGILFGVVADRWGRARALIFSILTYSVFTALTATSQTVIELILWRFLVGIGLGGEWAAGSVLVSETWAPEHRGKAIGLMQSGWGVGYIFAAILSALVLPQHGWRVLFVIGIVPALLAVWIRRQIPEPEIWKSGKESNQFQKNPFQIFRPPLLKRTLTATFIATSVLFAYWGLFTWMPTFLSTSVEAGGAGMSIVKSSGWIVVMQIGAFFGYILFGFFADKIGRKVTFIGFLVCAAVLVPIYGQLGRHEIALMVMGPFIGFFGHGYLSLFGVMLAELFPTHLRGTAQGFCFNVGRTLSALAPFTIGALADIYSIGSALALTSAFFLIGAGLILLLPETRGKELE